MRKKKRAATNGHNHKEEIDDILEPSEHYVEIMKALERLRRNLL